MRNPLMMLVLVLFVPGLFAWAVWKTFTSSDGEALFRQFIADPIPESVTEITGKAKFWGGKRVNLRFYTTAKTIEELLNSSVAGAKFEELTKDWAKNGEKPVLLGKDKKSYVEMPDFERNGNLIATCGKGPKGWQDGGFAEWKVYRWSFKNSQDGKLEATLYVQKYDNWVQFTLEEKARE